MSEIPVRFQASVSSACVFLPGGSRDEDENNTSTAFSFKSSSLVSPNFLASLELEETRNVIGLLLAAFEGPGEYGAYVLISYG